ncbi:MAG: hypothetical protein BGP19_04350 [Thiobacillus sp. 0-1251]|nr:MAG: hypothetical protein BGP19_04350 [Thiobacillus sp. 0-1251]
MPQVIKNGRIQDDEWKVLRLAENDEAATVWVPAGRVIVPLVVWQVQRLLLAGRAEAGNLAVKALPLVAGTPLKRRPLP